MRAGGRFSGIWGGGVAAGRRAKIRRCKGWLAEEGEGWVGHDRGEGSGGVQTSTSTELQTQ